MDGRREEEEGEEEEEEKVFGNTMLKREKRQDMKMTANSTAADNTFMKGLGDVEWRLRRTEGSMRLGREKATN